MRICLRSDESIKMMRNSREEELLTKQEGETSVDRLPVRSRPWSALKNPRIVRVSRTLGGKDRHSKVRTIRGLRDRRVRLSVPTAIQLYDLQDKLGLNQPSKVVDWLLNAAQHEIDKLPPLQMPPGNFIQFPQHMTNSQKFDPLKAPSFHLNGDNVEFIHDDRAFQLASSSVANGDILDNNTAENVMMVQKSTFWNSDVLMKIKEKEAMKEPSIEKGSMIKGDDVRSVGLQNNAMSYPSYHHWDPSNAHTSHLGSHLSHTEVLHNYQHLSMFASYMNAPADFSAKQYNHLHVANPASQFLPSNAARTSLQSDDPSLKLFQPNLAFKHRHSQDHQEG